MVWVFSNLEVNVVEIKSERDKDKEGKGGKKKKERTEDRDRDGSKQAVCENATISSTKMPLQVIIG
jgi:hypothetical protein